MVKKINAMLKKVYVDKLQEYDSIISEKEKQSSELDDEIKEKEKHCRELESKITQYGLFKDKRGRNSTVIPTEADFEDLNILEGYKKIKKGFNFDKAEMIRQFAEEHAGDDARNYATLLRIKRNFSHKIVLKISSFSKAEQKIIVKNLIDEKDYHLVEKIIETSKFSVSGFLKKLENLIIKNNPKINVYVGNEEENYDNIADNVRTIYDSNIVDGFRIEYKGTIYDYSI